MAGLTGCNEFRLMVVGFGWRLFKADKLFCSKAGLENKAGFKAAGKPGRLAKPAKFWKLGKAGLTLNPPAPTALTVAVLAGSSSSLELLLSDSLLSSLEWILISLISPPSFFGTGAFLKPLVPWLVSSSSKDLGFNLIDLGSSANFANFSKAICCWVLDESDKRTVNCVSLRVPSGF